MRFTVILFGEIIKDGRHFNGNNQLSFLPITLKVTQLFKPVFVIVAKNKIQQQDKNATRKT